MKYLVPMAALLLAAILCYCGTCVALAAQMSDDCTTAENSAYILYENWDVPALDFSELVDWVGAPDDSVLDALFSKGTPAVAYHISGVDTLTVSFYTRLLPLAIKNENGDYVLVSGMDQAANLDGTLPVSYSPVDGGLYLETPDKGFLCCTMRGRDLVFTPIADEEAFEKTLRDTLQKSMVTVAVSSDGTDYETLDYDIVSVTASPESESMLTPYFYVTLSLPIPSGMEFISVAANLPRGFYSEDGTFYPYASKGALYLASVGFDGVYLRWGSPEEEPPSDPEEDPGFYYYYRIWSTTQNRPGGNTTYNITNHYYASSAPSSQPPQTQTQPAPSYHLLDSGSVPSGYTPPTTTERDTMFLVCGSAYLIMAGGAIFVLLLRRK